MEIFSRLVPMHNTGSESNIYNRVFFTKIVSGSWPLTIFAKMPHRRCSTGFKYICEDCAGGFQKELEKDHYQCDPKRKLINRLKERTLSMQEGPGDFILFKKKTIEVQWTMELNIS